MFVCVCEAQGSGQASERLVKIPLSESVAGAMHGRHGGPHPRRFTPGAVQGGTDDGADQIAMRNRRAGAVNSAGGVGRVEVLQQEESVERSGVRSSRTVQKGGRQARGAR